MGRAPQRLLFLLAAAISGACGTSTSTATSLAGPSDVRCQPSVTASAASFGAEGGAGTLAIGVARECSWSVSAQAPWITITSAAQGQGDGSVSYRVAENPEPVTRQAALVVGERRVDVAQGAAPCRFSLSGLPETLPAQGGEFVAEVRTHQTCSWTASSQVPWAQVAPASGRGAGGVRVSVGANPGAERSIVIVVAGEPLTVAQRSAASAGPGTPAPSPAPAPSPSPTPSPSPAPAPSPPAGTSPSPVGRVELEGRIGGLAGSCPSVTFSVRGQRAYTTPDTRYKKREGCSSLRNGVEVEIDGTRMSDGRVRVDRVEIDD